jgi:hypothetical protein
MTASSLSLRVRALHLVRRVAALALAATALAAAAQEDPPGRIGRLAQVQGQIWMLEGGQGEWIEPSRNRPVTTGDRVATDSGARAALEIGSTSVYLDQGSDLEVRRLDDDAVELVLLQGAASVRVRSPEVAREVELDTHEGRFAPQGPGLFRVDTSDQGSFAAVFAGELQFDAPDSTLALRPGQRAEFWQDAGDNATHYSWADLTSDAFDLWVRRDDQLAQVRPPAQTVSIEMTGADDLGRYGRWDQDPAYGALWVPTAVQADWAPYRYGHWAWIAPWGWTWVDDAPWGFAPFHYGRWVNWRGQWCWAPGQYVARPVYAPALVAWVGGAHWGASVSLGAPAVGWVPLAPREAYYPTYRTTNVYIHRVNVTQVVIRPGVPLPRPAVYANRGLRGGFTVVPTKALAERQPVAKAMGRFDPRDFREGRDGRDRNEDRDVRGRPGAGGPATAGFVPPPPAGASLAPRVVPARGSVIAPPPRGFPGARAEAVRTIPERAQGGQGDTARPDANGRGVPNRGNEPLRSPNGRPDAGRTTLQRQDAGQSIQGRPDARSPAPTRPEAVRPLPRAQDVQTPPPGSPEGGRPDGRRPAPSVSPDRPAQPAPLAEPDQPKPRGLRTVPRADEPSRPMPPRGTPPAAMPMPQAAPQAAPAAPAGLPAAEATERRHIQPVPRAPQAAPQSAPQPAPAVVPRPSPTELVRPDAKDVRPGPRDNPRDNPRDGPRDNPRDKPKNPDSPNSPNSPNNQR